MGETNNSRRSKRKLYKKRLTIALIAVLLVFLSIISGFIVYNYNDIKYWNNLIYPGVSVESLNLSGKTKSEAKDMINKIYSEKLKDKKINISVGDKNYVLNYSSINVKFDIDGAVDSAYSYGKNSNIFKKYELLRHSKPVDYNLKFSFNEKPVKELVKQIASEVDRKPVNASMKMGPTAFNIVSEQSGAQLDQKDLQNQLLSKINYYLDSNFSEDLNVKGSLKTVSPKIKSSDLKSVDTLISTFSTNYSSSSSERANNITLATNSIDGTIVMPGKEFSFNGVVGERTAAKGYKAAPVIIGDKLESGLGGGICQVSTTLYNAVNKANLISTERVHHTMPVHYVPEGMDATVDYGNIDYKFKNNFKFPVYLQAYTSGGNIIFNIYSNSAAGK